MSERKPPGVKFETWIEKQIREATERGSFDGLAGAGKPIADIDKPRDENWWVKQKLDRENVSYLPPTLVLRKEAEDALAAAHAAGTEDEVREIIEAINEKILEALKKPLTGPPLNLVPYDVEQVLDDWRGTPSE